MLTVILAIISTIFMLVALAGIILPFVPGGVPVAWLGLFIFAIGTGFERISLAATLIFLGVMLLTIAVDFFSPMLGAGKYRASRWGILGAFIGSLLGIFILGLWGIILGPFMGAILGELIAGRKYTQAFKVGFGTIIGLILSSLMKVVVILIMLGFLIASWF
jgi:uncharacterized protein YqgC (DUF456 family)